MVSHEHSITSAAFDDFNSQLQSAALKATRNSMLLPSDVNFHRTMDPEFSKDLDAFSSRILFVANKLLSLADTVDPSGKGKGKLQTEDDVVDNFHAVVVDSMDQMMEKTDMSLDVFLGRNRAPAIAINTSMNSAPSARKGALDPAIQHASHLPKPQLKFKRKVANDDVPWRPSLSHKFNAQVPLGFNYHDLDSNVEKNSSNELHPYWYEISHISYPPRMFKPFPPMPPSPFESTTFTWVSTVADLENMLDELRKATEFAVDLEHHSYRSYAGFLCLMQISTRQQDWLIDLLVLREEMQILNEVFTDPKITKVFHGAESDIVWLQQDLQIYVVNLFDTFHASKALGFPRHGLANLLEMYCDFTPDKRYQLADWRIRPLPAEMLEYARSDTHFLLYIFDSLRNALLDRALSQSQTVDDSDVSAPPSTFYPPSQRLVREVLAKSEETALHVYQKEYYDADGGTGGNGWDTLAKKWNKINLYSSSTSNGISGMQKNVYRIIHFWRDRVAREEDESTRYVLPNHYLFQLAEQPPADIAAMLRIFKFVPPVLKRRAKELLDVIRDAVQEHLISVQEKPAEHEEVVNLLQDTVTMEQTLADTGSNNASLWKLGTGPVISLDFLPISVSSSLFGNAKLVSNDSESRNRVAGISTSRNTLFGKTVPYAASQTPISSVSRFAEVVGRIHSNLLPAPNAAKTTAHVTPGKMNSTVASAEVKEEDSLFAASQVEMPFVPASQRVVRTKTTPTGDETVLMVGQTRQKKRRRGKDSTNAGNADENSSNKDGEEAQTVPFDFDSASNILDAAPSAEQSTLPRKKAKQAKGADFHGNFPAPPKAYSEVKSGNRSHTFR
ncbi:hypothetical protein GYMLUDRAFT_150634 [Collybiopsis luxurians FD-317 M1]|nr:hypothetical protein GYMLUDRAFT_150634 [Collybiopsis luxurians FD-317 M1]